MKTLIFGLLLSTQLFAQGGERVGNGGSYTEAEIAAEQVDLELTVNKIKKFFIVNKELADIFPEFSIKEFFAKTNHVSISVVDHELFDKHNVKRTCLNYEQKIECDINELQATHSDPKILFVLMLHELLGIVKVEETSPKNVAKIDGYRISKRIARYVSRVSNYDLDLSAAPETFTFSTPTFEADVKHNGDRLWNREETTVSCKSDMDSVCMALGKSRAVSHKCSTKRLRNVFSKAAKDVIYFLENAINCGDMSNESMACQEMTQWRRKDAFLTKIVPSNEGPDYYKKNLMKVRETFSQNKYEYVSKIVCE